VLSLLRQREVFRIRLEEIEKREELVFFVDKTVPVSTLTETEIDLKSQWVLMLLK